MSEKYPSNLLAVTFSFVWSLLLTLGLTGIASAISFTTISSRPCVVSGDQDVSGYCGDEGIDYSQLNNKLVTAVQFVGLPYTPLGINNLDYLDPVTGSRSNAAPGFKNAFDELKVATVRVAESQVIAGQGGPACTHQSWPVGTIFTGYTVQNTPIPPSSLPPPGQFVMIESNGTVHGPFTLTDPSSGFTEDSMLRGGFFQDRFCAAPNAQGGGDLFIVSGSGDPNADGSASVGGNVWRVTPNSDNPFGAPAIKLLTRIFKPAPRAATHAHLEGVIVVPNDPAKYGPWAAKIVTGDEDRTTGGDTIVYGLNPKIYAIDPNTGACSQNSNSNTALSPSCTDGTFDISGDMPHPEDFDFVEGDFFGIAKNNDDDVGSTGQIVKAPGSAFNAAGDILINQEYPQTPAETTSIRTNACNDVGSNSGLYQIRWDGVNNQFVSTQLTRDTSSSPLLCQWEHVTFQPVHISITKSPKNATFNIGDTLTFTIVVTSDGPGTARNVTLKDLLPNGNLNWTFDTGGNPGGTCSISSNLLTCNFGDLAPNATRKVVVKTATGAPAAACNGQKINNTATATARGLPNIQDTGDYTCTPPQLTVVKTPDGGEFSQGSQVSFTIVVSNPASSGASPATNVTLTDTLPTNGALAWASVSTNQGLCTLSGAHNQSLNCSLGTIAAQKSVTVVVTSTTKTPNAACTVQDNPAAIAKAAGGLQAQDSGFLVCVPPSTGARITGGGSVFTTAGVRVTHGLELHCDKTDTPNNLEINWGGGNNFHLQTLTSVTCLDTALKQQPPKSAPFDTYIAEGTGICNKLPATIKFTFTDAGEPGTLDTAKYEITGGCTLSVPATKLTFGNHQTHAK